MGVDRYDIVVIIIISLFRWLVTLKMIVKSLMFFCLSGEVPSSGSVIADHQ